MRPQCSVGEVAKCYYGQFFPRRALTGGSEIASTYYGQLLETLKTPPTTAARR